ncbi:hypothetical protein OESDEN_05707 [Oesophagostomum dentatum]|uniref:Saposin B-type domain-containing protein n=1 Tax=Oesophagostomum dentatum TaxID=61180 RepID=A0A0B1TE16_OESDE|nr:hypothetical protein OESDEN_05707 [Oesophagostomum dentatum]
MLHSYIVVLLCTVLLGSASCHVFSKKSGKISERSFEEFNCRRTCSFAVHYMHLFIKHGKVDLNHFMKDCKKIADIGNSPRGFCTKLLGRALIEFAPEEGDSGVSDVVRSLNALIAN